MDKNTAVIQQLSSTFMSIPFNQMLGLKLDHVDNHYSCMSFNMKNELIGNFLHGILHGGVISSVLDMAGGILVMSSMVFKHPDATLEDLAMIIGKCSTVDLQVSFLRPGLGNVFTAKAWLQKSGNKIAFTRMELYSDTEKLIATASGTYMQGNIHK
ncbi:MAG TPA: thioesterase family protein [Gammaproteobacteria bacterium]|jgi:uncharacterized protein (TIGR00369 family)|nr:thioesterase family protein [Gammaproteobacteria bacterium]